MKRNGTVSCRSNIISSNQDQFKGRFMGEIIGNIATRVIWKLRVKTGTINIRSNSLPISFDSDVTGFSSWISTNRSDTVTQSSFFIKNLI